MRPPPPPPPPPCLCLSCSALHLMPALSPLSCCAHRRAVMQQVEASATLIDDMIQEVARELFLDAAVSRVMGAPRLQ